MTRRIMWTFGFILLLVLPSLALAQEDEEEDTPSSPTSSVDLFVVLCEDRVVFNASGTMQSGYDIFYQVFSGTQGTGTALTGLRQLPVNGAYSTSDVATYTGGTLPLNSVGSAYAAIAREGNPDSTLWNGFVDDLQDGCADPQAPPTAGSNPVDAAGQPIVDDNTSDSSTTSILTPFGGILNPNYVPPDKPLVQIGARDEFVNPRQETPGLIFAECEDFPVAEPGIVYDTDNVVVYWSWFTATEEQLRDHINTVDYSVTYYQTLPLPNVIRTQIQEIDGLYWVFYYSALGSLLPGRYYIEYKVNWDEPHFDGFFDYGPGTANEQLISGCDFVVLPNPDGQPVSHNPWPYQFGAAP